MGLHCEHFRNGVTLSSCQVGPIEFGGLQNSGRIGICAHIMENRMCKTTENGMDNGIIKLPYQDLVCSCQCASGTLAKPRELLTLYLSPGVVHPSLASARVLASPKQMLKSYT